MIWWREWVAWDGHTFAHFLINPYPPLHPFSLSLSTSGLQPCASTINAVIKKEAEREEAFTRLESALYLSFHPSLSHNPPTITPKCFHSYFPNSFPIYFYAIHCYVKNTSLSAIFGDGTVTSTCIQVQNLPFLCILNASNCVESQYTCKTSWLDNYNRFSLCFCTLQRVVWGWWSSPSAGHRPKLQVWGLASLGNTVREFCQKEIWWSVLWTNSKINTHTSRKGSGMHITKSIEYLNPVNLRISYQ